jgi:hypothetical protein
MIVQRGDRVDAAGGRWYSLSHVSSPTTHLHSPTYPPSPGRRLNGTRPAGQTPCNHHMCGRIRASDRIVVGKSFLQAHLFPEPRIIALKPPTQSRRVLAIAAQVGKTRQTPSACVTRFIHSTARQRIATQTRQSPATATVLAKPYTRHTMPIVHSARSRALFSELSRRHGWTR